MIDLQGLEYLSTCNHEFDLIDDPLLKDHWRGLCGLASWFVLVVTVRWRHVQVLSLLWMRLFVREVWGRRMVLSWRSSISSLVCVSIRHICSCCHIWLRTWHGSRCVLLSKFGECASRVNDFGRGPWESLVVISECRVLTRHVIVGSDRQLVALLIRDR